MSETEYGHSGPCEPNCQCFIAKMSKRTMTQSGEELKMEIPKCPTCGKAPRMGLTKTKHCQLHGDPYQDYKIECCFIKIERPSKEIALTEWVKIARQPLEALDIEEVRKVVLESGTRNTPQHPVSTDIAKAIVAKFGHPPVKEVKWPERIEDAPIFINEQLKDDFSVQQIFDCGVNEGVRRAKAAFSAARGGQ